VDTVRVLHNLKESADTRNEHYNALLEDVLGEFLVIDEKADEYVKKLSPSKQRVDDSVNRLYNRTSPKKPMSYYLMKTSPSSKQLNKSPPKESTKKVLNLQMRINT
jgi:hypothetical protein